MMKYATLSSAQQANIAPWDDEVLELSNEFVSVFRDRYPVTKGHLLFVPNNNTEENIVICMGQALITGRQMVLKGECDAYNIGINMGAAAGQTVMYPHVHLIPRRTNDTSDPVGGVRGVIPGQANYKKPTYQQPA